MKENSYLDDKTIIYWQKMLILTDWKLIVRQNCPIREFQFENVKAETEWSTENKTATIKIIADNEYTDNEPFEKEKVLIHELLHLKFALLWESNTDLQNALLHQNIEEMARLLFYLKKKGVKNENIS